MGSASLALDVWRQRKLEMKWKISTDEAAFIYRCIFNPNSFSFGVELYIRPYADKDLKNSKMTMRLKTWFKEHISDGEQPNQVIPKEEKEVSLKTVYKEHLESILKYYEPVGLRADFCDMYVPLMTKLSGKDLEKDDASGDDDEVKKEAAAIKKDVPVKL